MHGRPILGAAVSLALPFLQNWHQFPSVDRSWGPGSEAPGLLCAGADLSVTRLLDAYRHGIFPWFGHDQPILWWSPDPRMVLYTKDFRLRRSLKKSIRRFICSNDCEIRVDHDFAAVMQACANSVRKTQTETWIGPEMVHAYTALHDAGHAHSVETWVDGQLAGGLYCVCIGQAVFGESMFHRLTDASKIAIVALIAMCRRWGVEWIDCQQNTGHLASLGALETTREAFLKQLMCAQARDTPNWEFSPLYWNEILTT